jgi:hypothetical protein
MHAIQSEYSHYRLEIERRRALAWGPAEGTVKHAAGEAAARRAVTKIRRIAEISASLFVQARSGRQDLVPADRA